MSVTELTRELVAIPSHEDETAAGDFLESWLRRETDAAVTRDEAGNVIARKGSGDRLALVGHHDVVPPDESQVDETGERFSVEEREGRLYGRGAADMKGAVAAAAVAFADADPAGELVFASFVGEEVGGIGAQHAVERGFAPEYAVVCEGSTNYSGPNVTDVVVAHRGRRGSTISARGVAAHASEPEAGDNAIYRACDVVDAIRDLEPGTVNVAGERLSGSVAVTEIDGGSAINVVPDACTITVDERTVPGEYAPLEGVVDDRIDWTVDTDVPPMECTDDAFVDAILDAADGAQDGAPRRVTKPHATDAGWLNEAGTECVVFGPSEPGEAHTADESVSLAVLERCYRIYRDLAESWP